MFRDGDMVMVDMERWDFPDKRPYMSGTIRGGYQVHFDRGYTIELSDRPGLILAVETEIFAMDAVLPDKNDNSPLMAEVLRTELGAAIARIDELVAERDDLLDQIDALKTQS